jgi:hypothetical protein
MDQLIQHRPTETNEVVVLHPSSLLSTRILSNTNSRYRGFREIMIGLHRYYFRPVIGSNYDISTNPYVSTVNI